jgi:fluoroquinolone transport system permease protein
MKRVWNSLKYDVLSHFRNGIYYIYAIISVIYIIALRMIPPEMKDIAATIILFSDPSLLGFFFIGAIILLEKAHKTMENLFVTPLRIGEYIISKTIALSVVTVVFSFIIVLFSYQFKFNPFFLFCGVFLSSILFTLLGFIAAVKVKTLNGYLWIAPLYVVVAFLPIVEYLGFPPTLFYYLIPGKASLILIEAAFNKVGLGNLIYAFLTMAFLIILVYGWSRRVFHKNVIMRIGGQ